RAEGENSRAAVCGKAGQIDRNIGLQLADQARRIEIAHSRYVDEAVKGALELLPQRAVVIHTIRDRGQFKARAIMRADHRCNYLADRMFMEICGQIGEANTIMAIRRASP